MKNSQCKGCMLQGSIIRSLIFFKKKLQPNKINLACLPSFEINHGINVTLMVKILIEIPWFCSEAEYVGWNIVYSLGYDNDLICKLKFGMNSQNLARLQGF